MQYNTCSTLERVVFVVQHVVFVDQHVVFVVQHVVFVGQHVVFVNHLPFVLSWRYRVSWKRRVFSVFRDDANRSSVLKSSRTADICRPSLLLQVRLILN